MEVKNVKIKIKILCGWGSIKMLLDNRVINGRD
jgi:hypothetical protein